MRSGAVPDERVEHLAHRFGIAAHDRGGGNLMDLRKLKKLIDLVQESGIGEIEITEGEEKVRITRQSAPGPAVMMAPQMQPMAYGAPAGALPSAPTATSPSGARCRPTSCGPASG